MELLVAGLAFELSLLVPLIVHVLIRRALSKEFSIACVAFVSWVSVVKCIHVLFSSLCTVKLAIARLAFIVIVHVENVFLGFVLND
jgi:hypothetical protein